MDTDQDDIVKVTISMMATHLNNNLDGELCLSRANNFTSQKTNMKIERRER